MDIVDVEGIGPAYAAKLKAVGVNTVEKLLEVGASKKGRDELAEQTEISPKLILTWVNHADLMRIKGVGEEYSELLEVSGVDSPSELAQRVAANLMAKMVEINEARKLVRSLPAESIISDWIEQAKKLEKMVTH